MRRFATALAFLAGLLPFADADSTDRNPLRRIDRVQNAVIYEATPWRRIHAFSPLDLTFEFANSGDRVRLALEPNHDILGDGATITYLDGEGKASEVKEIDRLQHRVYRGDAFLRDERHGEWINAGWARVTVHQDGERPVFEGAMRLFGDQYHVQMARKFAQTRVAGDPEVDDAEEDVMVVWRDSDVLGAELQDQAMDELKRRGLSASTCASDQLTFNVRDDHPVYRRSMPDDWAAMSPNRLFGRDIDGGGTSGNGAGVNLSSTVGSPQGCPGARKVALIGIAADCNYLASFNSSATQEDIRSNIISQVNQASVVYENTFNISLGIQNLVVVKSGCPATAPADTPWNVACPDNGPSITDRLNLFSTWRGQQNDTNAYWSLFTHCPTGSTVGLAWLGQLCTQGSSTSTDSSGNNETAAAANVVSRTSTEWQVFAHESGHTFGAVHDCVSNTCADGTATKQQCCPLSASSCVGNGNFIMNPSTGNGITQFSPCSVGNICSALGRQSVRSTCLTNNKDVATVTGSQCGNGIVEAGEDCDCGGTQGCGNNPCCNPTTCKFTAKSVCDPSNEECCTQQCTLATNGTICRASTGACDIAETCTGTSAYCPADATTPDGTSCGSSADGLTCASGQCTSRDQQCKTLMGALASNNDTYACNSQGCQISCASPSFGPNTCYTMNQNFLDGTSCQGGGKCNNGNCVGSNVGDEISSWIKDNKNIFIPIVVVVGVFIIFALVSCCWSWYRRRKRRLIRKYAARDRRRNGGPKPPGVYDPQMSGSQMPFSGAYVPPPPPPGAYMQGGGRSRSQIGINQGGQMEPQAWYSTRYA